jgi:hypothetical protein
MLPGNTHSDPLNFNSRIGFSLLNRLLDGLYSLSNIIDNSAMHPQTFGSPNA